MVVSLITILRLLQTKIRMWNLFDVFWFVFAHVNELFLLLLRGALYPVHVLLSNITHLAFSNCD